MGRVGCAVPGRYTGILFCSTYCVALASQLVTLAAALDSVAS